MPIDDEVYNEFDRMAKKQGWDYTTEFINHMLEIWIQLDQFWKSVSADNKN
jgi:hypothetical protein